MRAHEVIHAEIEIDTHSDLPAQLNQALASRFPGGTSVAAALSETLLSRDLDVVGSVVLGRITHELVYLVFSGHRRSLTVHLQRRHSGNLVDVRRSAEETAERFIDFVNYHERRPRSIRIKIYVGGSHLKTGVRLSRWQRVQRALAAELLTTISLALTAILVSYALREEVGTAMLDGLVASLALLFRSVLSAATQRLEYEYV